MEVKKVVHAHYICSITIYTFQLFKVLVSDDDNRYSYAMAPYLNNHMDTETMEMIAIHAHTRDSCQAT